MAEVRGCKLPDDLYYWVEKHIWARPEPDGTVTIGMTDVAQKLAGKIIVVTPKGLGKTLAKGKSTGTLESGKWVGPVPTPITGEVVALNDEVRKTPALVNQDPYGAGWIARIKPADWAGESAALVTGAAGVERYRAFMEQEGLSCA